MHDCVNIGFSSGSVYIILDYTMIAVIWAMC